MVHRPLAVALIVGAFAAGLGITLTAGPSSADPGGPSLTPTTLPTTTSTSIPCVEVINTNPPAYLLVCPPV